jgi:hypothetical protein
VAGCLGLSSDSAISERTGTGPEANELLLLSASMTERKRSIDLREVLNAIR